MADDPNPKSSNRSAVQTEPPSLSPPQFSHLILKIAVSQICHSFGFGAAQSSALDALTKIAALYIESLASSATSFASVSGGRTQCNLIDIVAALELLRLPSGFPGAGDAKLPLLSSSVLKELSRFISAIDEVPFARRIPSPEGESEPACIPVNSRSLGRKRPEVPSWLPEFPVFVEDTKRVSRREEFWEDKAVNGLLPMVKREKEEEKRGDVAFMLRGRRERVKFRLGRKNLKVSVGDLELRNGVCIGGKRVCLGKRFGTFLQEDEDDNVVENGKL